VGEDLDFDGGALTDVGDLVPGQLPGEHRPLKPQISGLLDAVQIVQRHLGGGVEGQIGGYLPQHPQHAQILYQHRVRPDGRGVCGVFGGFGQLPVGEQGVQRQIDLGAPQMAIRNRRRKFLPGEILCIAAGVKIPISQIDGVRAVLHGRGHRLHGTGRRKQL